jgi:hypothetical protein
LTQYQGVHGTINNSGSALGGNAEGTDIDATNISPQEVAAFYANAINAK